MTEPTSARPHQRVSPEEREEAAERLRLAAGEGRLSLEELEQRLEAALSALTYGDLNALVDDLPVRPGSSSAPPASARLAVSDGHLERVGSWPIPRHLDVELAFASAFLDLRTSPLPSGGLEISLQALMSKIVLAVPDDAAVVVDELGRHSSKVVQRGRRARADGPAIRVVGDLRRSKLTVKRPG
jgi:hypothetical protein